MEDKIKPFVNKYFPDITLYKAEYKNRSFWSVEYNAVYKWLEEQYNNSHLDEANDKLKDEAIKGFYDNKGFE